MENLVSYKIRDDGSGNTVLIFDNCHTLYSDIIYRVDHNPPLVYNGTIEELNRGIFIEFYWKVKDTYLGESDEIYAEIKCHTSNYKLSSSELDTIFPITPAITGVTDDDYKNTYQFVNVGMYGDVYTSDSLLNSISSFSIATKQNDTVYKITDEQELERYLYYNNRLGSNISNSKVLHAVTPTVYDKNHIGQSSANFDITVSNNSKDYYVTITLNSSLVTAINNGQEWYLGYICSNTDTIDDLTSFKVVKLTGSDVVIPIIFCNSYHFCTLRKVSTNADDTNKTEKLVYERTKFKTIKLGVDYKPIAPICNVNDTNIIITSQDGCPINYKYSEDGDNQLSAVQTSATINAVDDASTIIYWAYYGDVKSSVYSYSYDYKQPKIELLGSENALLKHTVIYPYVDVMFNQQYENIKVLNSITYIVNNIKEKFIVVNPSEESLDRRYSGDNLLIYSDECNSGLLDININNKQSTEKVNGIVINRSNLDNDYKYPYWDKGHWNFSYFRNTNKVNKYNGTDTTKQKIETNRQYGLQDQHSMIFGKYFVTRFIFKEQFKLENVDVNIQLY